MPRHGAREFMVCQGRALTPTSLQCHGRVEALEVVFRLLVWVHRRSLHSAIRVPLLVLLLVSWSLRFACPISGDIEGLDLVDTVRAHADLGEEVLTHGTVLAILDAHLPVQLGVA